MNINNLLQYGEKMFKENDDKPYTGQVFDLYISTGNKVFEGRYRKGLRVGKWTYWDENGGKFKEGIYKDGKMVGIWTVSYTHLTLPTILLV